MGLPHKLKDFVAYADGDSYVGRIGEIALPKLTLKTEKYRGGGMLAEVDVAMGLEALEMEVKYGGLVRGVLRKFGIPGVAATMVRFVGAYQEDVAGAYLTGELVTRGRLTEIDPGTAKAGDNTEWTAKYALSYLKWTVNGREEVEIDVLNNIFMVDGVDRNADLRAALQL